MDFKHGSPPRIDRTDDVSMTDEDEHALEAIRRQLDMEFAHSTEPVVVTAPGAFARRGRVATVVGVLLVCATAGAAAVLVTPLYRALKVSPPVEADTRPAAPAPTIVVAARPSTPAPPASAPRRAQASVEPASRPQPMPAPQPVVPDVIRRREQAPPSPEPAAAAAPAVLATAPPPPVAVATPEPPRVDVPPPPEQGARAATGPSRWRLPLESAAAALAPLPLVELASEHIRTAWGTVKEHVVRAPGELRQGPRSGPEAP